jgi:hypothetical protein
VACFDEPPEAVECAAPPDPPACVPPPPSAPDFSPIPTTPTPTPAALRFCREADSVIEGFLCDEATVVSNACRKPKNALDAYICDEPGMHALQRKIWDVTEWIIRTVISAIVGGGPSSPD